jgi:hypothetical protein
LFDLTQPSSVGNAKRMIIPCPMSLRNPMHSLGLVSIFGFGKDSPQPCPKMPGGFLPQEPASSHAALLGTSPRQVA